MYGIVQNNESAYAKYIGDAIFFSISKTTI
ncbi:Uncharacterised protein [Clostridium perfringens]|nr:Uncharacterised protein [Clostridium perfringens]